MSSWGAFWSSDGRHNVIVTCLAVSKNKTKMWIQMCLEFPHHLLALYLRLQHHWAGDTLPARVSLGSTFEFEQLVLELRPCQLVDGFGHGVLVVQWLVTGVHNGGAVQKGHVPGAAVERSILMITLYYTVYKQLLIHYRLAFINT